MGRSRRLRGRVGTLRWFREGVEGIVFRYDYYGAYGWGNE